MTTADEPMAAMDVVEHISPAGRQGMRRTLTSSPGTSAGPTPSEAVHGSQDGKRQQVPEIDDGFSILKVDLNLGVHRQVGQVLSHLAKGSISSLLVTRFDAALSHLETLQKRVYDAQSRVLVTGDLNAGKSTLVNALLRRDEIMPTDEQPLTTRFVEVVPAKENDGQEEIHVLDQDVKYDPLDKATYTTVPIEKLNDMATDSSADAGSPPLRVYLKDAKFDKATILHNGVVDISLIDAPGLNRDSILTTANFARQEEIDVVVFVVSAANHFTLSAKEFIWQAGHEKAHLFIVVNRFDQIKNKERCRQAVLEQIKQLSPETYSDAADLVHFVDSAKVALGYGDDAQGAEIDDAFSHLEHSLRSFVLVNRAKSKLGPAQNYLTHLLADVELLASANALIASRERDAARAELSSVKPVLDKLKKGKDGLDEALLVEEEKATEQALSRSKTAMERSLERVGRGEQAAPAPGMAMPTFPGVMGAWDYAGDVRKALLASIDFAVSLAEDDARSLTVEGVKQVSAVAEKYLPADVERSNRIFNSKAMYHQPSSPMRGSRKVSGVATVGLNLVNQRHLVDVNVSDIFDIQHHIFLARAQLPATPAASQALVPFSAEVSGIGAASLALGAWTMVGGHGLSVRSVIDGLVRISDLASNPAARKWVGPVLGVVACGAVAYVIYDLPNSIPRNVGRSIQSTLSLSAGAPGSDNALVPFTEYQSARISKEVRKVLRLAGGDVRDRFKGALDARAEVVRQSEETERRCAWSIDYMKGVGERVQTIRDGLGERV